MWLFISVYHTCDWVLITSHSTPSALGCRILPSLECSCLTVFFLEGPLLLVLMMQTRSQKRLILMHSRFYIPTFSWYAYYKYNWSIQQFINCYLPWLCWVACFLYAACFCPCSVKIWSVYWSPAGHSNLDVSLQLPTLLGHKFSGFPWLSGLWLI